MRAPTRVAEKRTFEMNTQRLSAAVASGTFPTGILNRIRQPLQSAFNHIERRGNCGGIVGRHTVAR